jgi:hypothetical protein
MTRYAVAWRDETEAVQTGRLDLDSSGIRLEGGRHRSGRLSMRRVVYRDLVDASMAPTPERVGRLPTIVLRGHNGSLFIAPLAAGSTRELLQLVKQGVESEAA